MLRAIEHEYGQLSSDLKTSRHHGNTWADAAKVRLDQHRIWSSVHWEPMRVDHPGNLRPHCRQHVADIYRRLACIYQVDGDSRTELPCSVLMDDDCEHCQAEGQPPGERRWRQSFKNERWRCRKQRTYGRASNDAYLSVTVSYITPEWCMIARVHLTERHTADHIAKNLKATTDEWRICDIVNSCVHDGADNIKDVSAKIRWVDIGCSAHKLHVAITSSMGIDKVSNLAISKCVKPPCSSLFFA